MNLPQRATLVIWSAAAAFLLALLAAAASLVHNGERDALARASERTTRLANGAQAGLNRTLKSLDLKLTGMGELLLPALDGHGGLDATKANHALATLKSRQLVFHDAAVIDGSGRTLGAATSFSAQHGLRLPAGFAAEVWALSEPRLHISEPARSGSSRASSLFLARAWVLPGGQRMVAVVEVPTELLGNIVAQAMELTGLAITLERNDGLLMLSVPADLNQTGHPLAPAVAAAGGPAAATQAPGRLDGAPAMVAARTLVYPELKVVVSLPLSEALADWRRERMNIALVTAAFVLVTLGAAAMAAAQFKRLWRTRQALAQSAATLDQAMSAMADGFLLCDADDRVVRWNEQYLVLFPWQRPVLAVGVPFRRLAEAAAAAANQTSDDVMRQAWIEQRIGRHLKADRDWEQDLGQGVVVNAKERRTPDGGVVSVYRDVSAAERRLAQARDAAEGANRAKSQFLATMSHEIRTPLNAVLGLNALMLDSTLTFPQRQHAEMIRNSGQILLALINDVLDVSRVEAGAMTLEHTPFSPAAAAQEVVALLQERAKARGLDFSLHIVNGPPPYVLGDAMRWRQVLFNLVGNALKFTEHGHVRVELRHHRPAPDTVDLHVDVADTGGGIAREDLPRLFEPFVQGDSSTARRHGGTGLGLTITQELVQLMGGRVEVESQPGQGSVFRVVLPGLRAAATGSGTPAALPAMPPRAERALRILVAEDNPVNQLLIEAVLTRMGHRCDIARNGREAVARAGMALHDLLLMDVQMPEMDGLAATHAIRALPGPAGRVPIVAMTANALLEDRQRCLAAGMDDYLSKPIDLHALAAAIARVTPQSSALAPGVPAASSSPG
jgi:signal transduction histidine kinase/ActR/RegA family two-component response regulator